MQTSHILNNIKIFKNIIAILQKACHLLRRLKNLDLGSRSCREWEIKSESVISFHIVSSCIYFVSILFICNIICLLFFAEFTDNLLTAQCFVFFIAGFETSSGTLSFALYELAKHPEIQEKLFDEINKTLEENDGSFDYECLQKMPYMDQVVSGKYIFLENLSILFNILQGCFKWKSSSRKT